MTKGRLRNTILFRLKNQKEEDRRRKSKLIAKKLFNSDVFKKAKKLMFYISSNAEVNTKKMIRDAQKLGKTVAVPTCQRNRKIRPCFFEAGARLKKGPYGIYEPMRKNFINPKELDLVVVPGVAFDRKGNRLGRGKGYYDRFLKRLTKHSFSVGLAFDFQVLPSLPTAAHDRKVNKVIFA